MSTIYVNSYLQAGNWWEAGGAPAATAVYQPKGAASYAASLVDLSGNGNDAVDTLVSPSWSTATGWSFTGTESLRAPVNQSETLTVICQHSSWSAGTLFGARGDPRYWISVVGNRWHWGGLFTSQIQLSTGNSCLAADNIYQDGVFIKTTGTSWTPGVDDNIGIGALNDGGSPTDFATASIIAIALYPTVTGHGTWVPAVAAAMAAL